MLPDSLDARMLSPVMASMLMAVLSPVLGPGLVWSLAEPPLGPVSVPVESLMALALALARVRLRRAVVREPEWLARVSPQ